MGAGNQVTMAALALAIGVAGFAGQAAAYSTSTYSGDSAFHDATNGDVALGEFRWGNSALNGDWEVAVGFPTSSSNQSQANFVWDGSAIDFTLDYIPSYDGLLLTYGDDDDTLFYFDPDIDLSGYNSIALRTDGRFGSSSISNVMVSGGTESYSLSADGSVEYLVIEGFDPTSSFTVSGSLALGLDDQNRGSRPSFQIKAAHVTPIPLPGALPLLLVALGGIGVAARLRARA